MYELLVQLQSRCPPLLVSQPVFNCRHFALYRWSRELQLFRFVSLHKIQLTQDKFQECTKLSSQLQIASVTLTFRIHQFKTHLCRADSQRQVFKHYRISAHQHSNFEFPTLLNFCTTTFNLVSRFKLVTSVMLPNFHSHRRWLVTHSNS